MAKGRTTTTHRRCPECDGAGEVTVNRSGFYATGRQDPQCDEAAPCPAPDCINGWIRVAPVDALAQADTAAAIATFRGFNQMFAAHFGGGRACKA